MSLADRWLDEYDRTRPGYRLSLLKLFSIAALVVGLVALLWSAPTPDAFASSSEVLNWGTLFLMAAIVYYFIVSIALAFGLVPFVVGVVGAVVWLDRLYTPLWAIGTCLIVLALFGQYLEHVKHGRRTPLLRELQLTMIGPLWVLAALYRRLGIPY